MSTATPSDRATAALVCVYACSDPQADAAAVRASLGADADAGTQLLLALPPGQAVAGLPVLALDAAADPLAVLRACAATHPGRDIVLVAAGALLPQAWLPRLRAVLEGVAEADCAIALGADPLLDPFAAPAGTRPDPVHASEVERRDALCHALAERGVFTVGRWSPTVSLWRGSALARLQALAWPPTPQLPPSAVAVALDHLYIGRAARSVGGEFDDAGSLPEGADGAQPAPVAALAARARAFAGATLPLPGLDGRPVLLHLLHGWGGGAARFVADLAAADDHRHHLVLVARADPGSGLAATHLDLLLDPALPPVHSWPLATPIAATAIASPEYRALLQQLIARWRVAGVMVSLLIGHALDALDSGLPTAVVCHDYYPLWPLLHADFGDAARDFSSAAIPAALAATSLPFAESRVAYWQALRSAYVAGLQRADALMVAPSHGVQANSVRIEPALAARRWVRIEHGLAAWPEAVTGSVPRPAPAPAAGGQRPLRVLVPGRINEGKGERLLAALLRHPLPGIELLLLGAGRSGMRFFGRSGVHVLMDYPRDRLPALLERLQPDLALLPSTVSETWSYMLSELWSLRVPVLATRLGSFEERIADGDNGLLVAPDAAAVAARLRAIAADRTPLQRLREASVPQAPSTQAMAAAYRAALPLQAVPGTAPIRLLDPLVLRLQALELDLAATRAGLARAAEVAAGERAELERRAEWGYALAARLQERTAWAQSLEQDLHRAQAALAVLQQEFDERTAWALSLRDELDEVRGERDRMRGSLSWRITRPLRGVRRKWHEFAARLRFQAQRLRALRHRARRSLAHRGVRGSLQRLRQEFAAAPAPAAPALPVAQPFAPFTLPVSEQPRASIVIPAWNHFDATHVCLRAIAALEERTPFEVIVVDDCSSDETAARLPQVAGLRYLRNERNLGFIGACNRGAEAARGEFLVFLNNDTAVQAGWLDALIDTFGSHQRVGLVGAKLVYPDGRLQEAGGIVFRDGSGWNYGRFGDPADPRYNHVREVDYCSGAALAVPRALFESVGGFDAHYTPAYYEDTDLAMQVRRAGLRALYQPASVVVHFEGVSSGTDTGSGVKAYQVSNQQKYLQRWRAELAAHPAPGTDIAIARAHRARRRVLVIDATTPAPDQDSGSLRLVNLMQLLLEDGCAVTFFADNRAFVPGYSQALQQLGVEVLAHPWLDDPVGWFRDNGRRFDVVFVSRHYIASSYIGLVRLHAPQARFVFDTVDLHYLREQRAAELEGREDLQRTAAETRARELALVRQADVTLVVSPVEQELLAREAPGARVEILSNVHAVHGRRHDFGERADVVFVGGFQHPPNVDAAIWLVEEILPLVRAELPDLRLHLIGSKAGEAVRALAQHAGVVFHGYVPDIDPYMDGCRLALAPLRYGAGVKGKVNLSMAHGQPVVATACAVEGMFAVPGRDVLVADDAAGFAREVVRAYRDEALWTHLSDHGLENVRRYFSFDAARDALRRIID